MRGAHPIETLLRKCAAPLVHDDLTCSRTDVSAAPVVPRLQLPHAAQGELLVFPVIALDHGDLSAPDVVVQAHVLCRDDVPTTLGIDEEPLVRLAVAIPVIQRDTLAAPIQALQASPRPQLLAEEVPRLLLSAATTAGEDVLRPAVQGHTQPAMGARPEPPLRVPRPPLARAAVAPARADVLAPPVHVQAHIARPGLELAGPQVPPLAPRLLAPCAVHVVACYASGMTGGGRPTLRCSVSASEEAPSSLCGRP